MTYFLLFIITLIILAIVVNIMLTYFGREYCKDFMGIRVVIAFVLIFWAFFAGYRYIGEIEDENYYIEIATNDAVYSVPSGTAVSIKLFKPLFGDGDYVVVRKNNNGKEEELIIHENAVTYAIKENRIYSMLAEHDE